MSEVTVGGINFGSIPDPFKNISDNKKNSKNSVTLNYIELIQQIFEGKIDVTNTTFNIINYEDDNIYYFDNNLYYISSDGETGGLFNVLYSDKDIAKVLFKINYNTSLEDVKHTINKMHQSKAKSNVINMLEKYYIDLDMEIDNCQGCMEGLEDAMEELSIIDELVKYLGGNIEAHKQELIDNWYKEASIERTIKEAKERQQDDIIGKLKLPIDKVCFWENRKEFNDISNMFMEVYDKLNEVCNILRNSKNLN